MVCWRGVTPNVIPDSIPGSKPSDSDSSTTTRRGDCAHDQPDPHPPPPGHTNHQRDRNTGLRTSRLGRAALHHLRHLRLPLPRRPPATPRPLPQLDPQGRRQDHHPTPQRRAAGPLPALVPSPPTPTRATHRTRDPLPGDHRDRTATSGRPQKAQPQTATKNPAHLEDVGGHCRLGHVDHLQATDSPESCRYESMTRPQPATELKVAVVGPGLILITYTTDRRERHQRKTEFPMAPVRKCMETATPPRDASHSQLIAVLRKRMADRTRIGNWDHRSEEHTSELQSRQYLVCRLLLE